MKTEELYKLFLKHPVISTDSRNNIPGSIFFALSGLKFDGNIFAEDAISSGSVFAVVDDISVVKNKKYIHVKNTLETLQNLAAFHRKKLGLPVIAITGTNGKTTTKEIIAAILSQKYQISATQGNLNNHIGVPLSLLKMGLEDEFGIIEMGANHIGEIENLCRIAFPDYGLITNIGKAHLEGFGSFENIIKTKTELYRFIENNNGNIFINSDNDLLISNIVNSSLIKYGSSGNPFLKGEYYDSSPFLKLKLYQNLDHYISINTNLIGKYNFENVLAAACIGHFFKVPFELIKKGIESYYPTNNRSQYIEKNDNKIIMDAYNANPTSMLSSIENFLKIKHSEKTIILGDMLELGESSFIEHQKIVNILTNSEIKRIYLVGNHFLKTNTQSPIRIFDKTSSLFEYLKNNPVHKNYIFIKGSRGMQLEKILDAL